MAKWRKGGKRANRPTSFGLPQGTALSGSHPSHRSKKAKLNPHQGQEKKVNIGSQGQVISSAGSFNEKIKSDTAVVPDKHGKVELSASQVYQKSKFTTSAVPVHQAKAAVIPQTPTKSSSVNAAGSLKQEKIQSTPNQGHKNVTLNIATTSDKQGKSGYTNATNPGLQVKGKSSAIQAQKKANAATHGSQGKFASTAIQNPNKTSLTPTARFSGQAKVGGFTHTNPEPIAGTKAHPNAVSTPSKQSHTGTTHSKEDGKASYKNSAVNPSRSVDHKSNNRTNTSVFLKGKPKTEHAATQRPRVEEMESSSSDSGSSGSSESDSSDNDEDSDDQSEVALPTSRLIASHPVKTVKIHSSSESGSDSEDGEEQSDADSDDGSNVKAIVKRVSSENAKVDEGYNHTSDSGHASTRIESGLAPVPRPKTPKWFSQKVKKILESLNCPDAVPYKAIKRLTHYRAWLEKIRHRRWKRYTLAGHKRYELTKLLLQYRTEGNVAAFQHRFLQHRMWKEEGLRAMQKLEKIVKGIKLLDDNLEIIFSYERKMYKDFLDAES